MSTSGSHVIDVIGHTAAIGRIFGHGQPSTPPPPSKTLRAALYLRVSTDGQTVENQKRDLEAAAAARGWQVTVVYADEGTSGAKGRDRRPRLDAMLKDAVRRRFDVVMCTAVDRLGRSLQDLVGTLQELHGAKVDLFMLQTALDTTTPAGRAMFGMLGVFAEFERSMIQSRVKSGMARAKAEQDAGKVRVDTEGKRKKLIGRPKLDPTMEAAIRARLLDGAGMLKIAAELKIGSGTVQRVNREMKAAA